MALNVFPITVVQVFVPLNILTSDCQNILHQEQLEL